MYFVSSSKPSLVAQMVKNLPAMQKTWIQSLGWEDSLEKEMVTHSSILTWKTPWTEELGRLQSMGSQRVRPDWETSTFTFNAKWQKHLPLQALPSLMELTVPKLSGWCQGICSHSWWLSTLHGSDERRGRKRKKLNNVVKFEQAQRKFSSGEKVQAFLLWIWNSQGANSYYERQNIHF